MTHFSDTIRNGAGGLPPDTRQTPGTLSGNPGVAITPILVYTITPATGSTTALATTISSAAGSLTLSGGTGIGTTSTTITVSSGTRTVIDLGVERAITISGDTGVTVAAFTINGYDDYQVPVTATLSGPSGYTTVTTTKTFRYVYSASVGGATGSGVTIGTADTFGFRVRANNFGETQLTWGNTGVTATTGFTAAVATDPATATTGNVRGTYAVQSAADGAKKLSVWIASTSTDTVTQMYGVAQYSSGF